MHWKNRVLAMKNYTKIVTVTYLFLSITVLVQLRYLI